jgi:hypothetical protein
MDERSAEEELPVYIGQHIIFVTADGQVHFGKFGTHASFLSGGAFYSGAMTYTREDVEVWAYANELHLMKHPSPSVLTSDEMFDDVHVTSASFMDERCPKCGCSLLTNGEFKWCSFVGGDGQKACDYGLNSDIPV